MEIKDKYGLYDDEKESTGLEMMVAYQSTVIALNCLKPCSGVFTYNIDKDSLSGQYMILKILPYIEIGGKIYGPSDAQSVKASDTPGSVICSYKAGNVDVSITISPLILDAESLIQSGGWVYNIKTNPSCKVHVNIGGGKESDMVGWNQVVNEEGELVDLMVVRTRATMVSEKFREAELKAEIMEDYAKLKAVHPYVSIIGCDGKLASKTSPEGGTHAYIEFGTGSGTIYGVFSRDESHAKSIFPKDYKVELEKSVAYYKELMKSQISTPDKNLDFAFASAVYNMDYSYLSPYGWVEAIHHWMSIWHQQHCLAADWLGQTQRSKQVIRSQAAALYPSGAAPMFYTNGNVFRAFGGTDHFFLWQVRHYLLHTNDEDFAVEILPFVERVIENCLKENDPGGQLKLHWGEQIGNQEDYISHIHHSSSPTMEVVNMLEAMVFVCKLAKNDKKEIKYAALARKGRNSLETLWDTDLGRYIYQVDTTGKKHLEGQYQTYIYPCIYEFVDEYDAYTSIRHLRDMLIGEKGELYCSNNFPNHMAATLGTQAGPAQQPWGAIGLAKMGFCEQAILPLKYIADIVSDPEGCAGSWPEGTAPYGSYFSPPAAVFIQSIIEAIFGLKMNMPSGSITISPCMPPEWPNAAMQLPGLKVEYSKKCEGYFYSFDSNIAVKPVIKWRLPFGKIKNFTIDGEKVEYKVVPCVNGIILESCLPETKSFRLNFEFSEIKIDVEYPKVVTEGGVVRIKTPLTIKKVVDRSSISSDISINNNIDIILKDNITRPYSKYGKLGMLNFSKRTLFLNLLHEDGLETIYPVDLTIVPRIEVKSELYGDTLIINLRNNMEIFGEFNREITNDVSNNCTITIGYESLLPEAIEDSCGVLKFKIPENLKLFPGKNEASLFYCNAGLNFIVKKELTVISDLVKDFSTPIHLSEHILQPDSCWRNLKRFPFITHMPWINQKDPMVGIKDDIISHPLLPIKFEIIAGKFAPVSYEKGKRVQVPVGSKFRKFYVLLFAFLDNHDIFSPVLRITAQRKDKKLISKEYNYPGDLDSFWAANSVGCFSTAHSLDKRTDELLSIPEVESGNWLEMKPKSEEIYYFSKEYKNSFPASSMWSEGYTIKLPHSYAGIIEFDMQRAEDINTIIIESIGTNPAFGVMSINGI